MKVYHIKVEINGEPREYDTSSEGELMMDLQSYNANGFPYSVSRRDE